MLLTVVASFAAGTAFAQQEFDKPEYDDPEIVRNQAQNVLSGPEFRNLPRLDLGEGAKQTEKPKPKKSEANQESAGPSSTSGGFSFIADFVGVLVWFAVAAVLTVVFTLIVMMIYYGIRKWERTENGAGRSGADASADDEQEPWISPGERAADAWLAAARAAAAEGRFDEALSLLLLGAMGHAERAGLIRPRRGLTYRDYLRAVPESSPWHAALDRLIRAYSPVGFGRREATSAAFESALGPYETALAIEPAGPYQSAT